MPPFVAYHRVDGATHQGHVDTLGPQGFRPISLSVSGDPADARYAAVWVQEPGPAWAAVHNVDAAGYQERFDSLVADGFAPVLVSAAGPASGATFAALFEQGVDIPWFARHNLRWDPPEDPDTLTHENRRAFAEGYLPRCLAVYGDPADRRFAGVWARNDGPIAWSWWWTAPDAYQRWFEGLRAGGMRPAHVAVAPDGFVLSVFRDETIGPWSAHHGLDGDAHQAAFEAELAAGLFPVMVQAGGTGPDASYASVFATGRQPLPRTWTVTGQNGPVTADLDAAVQTFMTAHAIRGGAVAVARSGRSLVSRGYTWAERGYRVVQPDTVFRIASVSKLLAVAAAEHLVTTGQLMWTTTAFPALGITSALLPTQTPDPAAATITVRQLVERRSGLQRDFGADLRTIASRIGTAATPTADQLVRYLYGEPLAHPPGSTDLYSNAAFFVLQQVIESVTGRPVLDAILDVTRPLGINDISVASTVAAGIGPNEVQSYDHPGVALSLLAPTSSTMEPNAYGGDHVLETAPAAGGLVTSAPSIARFIGTHAVWDVGGRQVATRFGTLEGTCAGARSRPDGLDFAFLFNRRVTDDEHGQINAAIDAVLDRHAADLSP